MANDQDTFHADLCEFLTILGMGDHSRPQSPHEVFQEALGVLRERLSLAAPTPTPLCPMCGAYGPRWCDLEDECGGVCPWVESGQYERDCIISDDEEET